MRYRGISGLLTIDALATYDDDRGPTSVKAAQIGAQDCLFWELNRKTAPLVTCCSLLVSSWLKWHWLLDVHWADEATLDVLRLVRTLDHNLEAILRKLGVRTRAAMSEKTFELGLIPAPRGD